MIGGWDCPVFCLLIGFIQKIGCVTVSHTIPFHPIVKTIISSALAANLGNCSPGISHFPPPLEPGLPGHPPCDLFHQWLGFGGFLGIFLINSPDLRGF